jgi:LPS-assembly lipoprotein
MSCSSSARARSPLAGRALALALIALLAGCGFHPLYAPRGPHDYDPALAAIQVGRIPERNGQLLQEWLTEELNPEGIAVPVRYDLTVGLVVSRGDLGVQVNATTTRGEVTVAANFKVIDAANRGVLLAGTSHAVGGFDVLSDAYATKVAEDAARERALRELADDLAIKLTLFVKQQDVTAK